MYLPVAGSGQTYILGLCLCFCLPRIYRLPNYAQGLRGASMSSRLEDWGNLRSRQPRVLAPRQIDDRHRLRYRFRHGDEELLRRSIPMRFEPIFHTLETPSSCCFLIWLHTLRTRTGSQRDRRHRRTSGMTLYCFDKAVQSLARVRSGLEESCATPIPLSANMMTIGTC